MEALSTPEFWIAVGQIIMIDILLGGDNADVIALAGRKKMNRTVISIAVTSFGALLKL